jgi:four helix bundle protein
MGNDEHMKVTGSNEIRPEREDWIERTHRFAVVVLKIVNRMPRTTAGRAMGFQLAKSGPSVVHNLEEAKGASTVRDRYSKTVIARKEARECRRSLLIVRDADLLTGNDLDWAVDEAGELVAMITAGTKRLEAHIPKRRPR